MRTLSSISGVHFPIRSSAHSRTGRPATVAGRRPARLSVSQLSATLARAVRCTLQYLMETVVATREVTVADYRHPSRASGARTVVMVSKKRRAKASPASPPQRTGRQNLFRYIRHATPGGTQDGLYAYCTRRRFGACQRRVPRIVSKSRAEGQPALAHGACAIPTGEVRTRASGYSTVPRALGRAVQYAAVLYATVQYAAVLYEAVRS